MIETGFLERHTYNDSLESASNFNTRLLVERQSRLPFFDTQTNVAQVNSHGGRKACERQTSMMHGVVYTYHPRYWKKVPKPKKVATPPPVETEGMEGVVEPHPLMEQEEAVSPPEEPTPEDLSPVSDDYEVYSDRKRKRQSRGAARRSKDTRSRGSRSRKGSVVNTRSAKGTSKVLEDEVEPLEEPVIVPKVEPQSAVVAPAEPALQPDGKKKPSLFCDFCLGDNLKNKKSGGPEEMISCVDCGRSAHPTCLQFEGSLAANVKSYNWQCLECKSCSICGTSDHDDQLLFCDECDRGFHMYCLTPRIEKPPEGRWECHLCKK